MWIGATGRRISGAVSGAVLALSLAACGGGGGAGPTTPSQTPTPTPTPAPTPTPTPTVLDTVEYRRSNAATFIDSLAAYTAGATGTGVKIAVIDSGVDDDSAEFAGRIDPASRDIAGSRGVDDEEGHGTAVAAIALAAKNDTSVHGIAFGATLIALRTDTPGSCGSSGGCSHADNDIAAGVNAAVAAGARVINLSLGGEAPNAQLSTAIANATAAGVLIVISAGNEGETATGGDPDPFAQIANNPAVAHGRVLIAGSVNASGIISSFSNRAGNSSAFYLAALGDRVLAFDHTGQEFLFSGTSFAAPAVSAAVALLAQAFPNLTADEIVEILLNSARDAGAAGTDSIYGHGILDIARAFTAQGGTSLAGGKLPVTSTPGSIAVTGGALGDGGKLGTSLGGVIVTDGYGRAYVADLGAGVARGGPAPKLAAALNVDSRETTAALGTGGYGFALAGATTTRPWLGLAQAGVDARPTDGSRVTRGFVTGAALPGSTAGFAFGYGADDLLARMRGDGAAASFVTGGDVLRDDGLAITGTTAAAMTQRAGKWTFGIATAKGEAMPLTRALRREDNRITQAAASVSRIFARGSLTFSYGRLDEAGTVLGAEGSATLGLRNAATDFVGLDAIAAPADGWTIAASARAGRTRLGLAGGGLASGAAPLTSLAMSFDVARAGVFAKGDRLALRIAQPLRVEAGALRLDVPVSYDYDSETPGYERRSVSLAPTGREIDVEAAWSVPLGFGRLDANLYWRRDPGHFSDIGDDAGAAVRLSARF